MCLVWRGGPSSWNIWTRSVPRSSPWARASAPQRLSRASWARVSAGHGFSLLMSTPTQGCSSIPSSRPSQSHPHGRSRAIVRRSGGSGAASGVQALHQQDQRSALARCRKTQFFLHALFFYISFYASPLVNAQFRACNQCRKESSPKSLGSLSCTLPFS